MKTELQAEEKRLEEAGDKKTLASSSLENPRFLLFFRRIMDFDPLPVLQKIHCPVLAIYGELDRTVPVHGNREVLEQALERAVTVRLFPRANHALLEARTGSNDEFPDSTRFAPGFLDCMVDWILAKKNRGY